MYRQRSVQVVDCVAGSKDSAQPIEGTVLYETKIESVRRPLCTAFSE